MELTPSELEALGIFTPKTLVSQAKEEPAWTVEGLFQATSVNLLIGDSGLGKTPLMVQLGVSVAAGLPFLGRPVRRGTVLYADFESSAKQFLDITTQISKFLKLPEPPRDFLVWSPEWKKPARDDYRQELIHRVERLNPSLVIVDPLRLFDPDAPVKNEDAAKLFKQIRRNGSTATWVLLHHRKKSQTNPDPFRPDITLEENPREWLQSLSGAMALINHTDTRLGVVEPPPGQKKGADLILNGFVRGMGSLQPAYLVREPDEQGEDAGYRLSGNMDALPAEERVAFKILGDTFKYPEIKEALKTNSHSKIRTFTKKLEAAGLARNLGKRKGWTKIDTEPPTILSSVTIQKPENSASTYLFEVA